MDFFERQDLARTNSRKIILLFLLALPCVIAAVYLVSVGVYAVSWAFFAFCRSVFAEIHPWQPGATAYFISFWQPGLFLWVSVATLLVVVGGGLYKLKQLGQGGQVVALLLGGERLHPQTKRLDELRLLHVVEEMSVASGTPVPDVYILRGEFGLNAFVAGHTVSDMVVCVTEGCLRDLTRDELQGVIAHEYSHIFNGDMRLNMRLMGIVHGLFCLTLFSNWVMYVPEPKPMAEPTAEPQRPLAEGPETKPTRAPAEAGRVAGRRPAGSVGTRLLAPEDGTTESSASARVEAKDALANVGVPVGRHLAYAVKLMEALPEPVRRCAREPRGATVLIYALLLSPAEGVREAQLRLLKSRLGSEASSQINTVLSGIRDLNALVKIPLVELSFPALRRLSLLEYAAFMENTAALIAADQQVDLLEFALQKMLRRHLEPKFKPVPRPEVRYSAVEELGVACSALLSALAHAGQDTTKAARIAFERGVKPLNPDGANFQFVTLAECTFLAVEAALDDLAKATPQLKKLFLGACAQTVVADGCIRPREAELLRAVADSLDCPMPPLVPGDVFG